MYRSLVPSILVLTLAAGAAAFAGNETITIGSNRTITVETIRTGARQVVATSTTFERDLDLHLKAEMTDGTRVVDLTSSEDGSVTIHYESPRASGDRTVIGGRIVSDTFVGDRVAADADVLLDALIDFDENPGDFTFGPQLPVPLNWKCEMATLKVMVECGTLQISDCGDAVQGMLCACAPEPKPASCD